MSEQAELRECPFCGSTDIRRDIGWLECNSCGCYGPNAEVNDDDTISLSAIAAWNQRAAYDEGYETYSLSDASEPEKLAYRLGYGDGRGYERREKEAELAALRAEKNEAIGAALQVEQKCYDQAQELAALRALREAVEAARAGRGTVGAIKLALAACDKASAPTGDEHK